MSDDMVEIPDAATEGLQCGGGTMHVYRGATLYSVGGVLICSECLGDVRDALHHNAEWVDRIMAEDRASAP